MAEVVLGKQALADLERLFEFLAIENPRWAAEAVRIIDDGLQILRTHPLVGRPVPGSSQRELVISKGSSGYLALYRYDEAADEAVIMAIRHQRESGYN